jgi:hypothetical protein
MAKTATIPKSLALCQCTKQSALPTRRQVAKSPIVLNTDKSYEVLKLVIQQIFHQVTFVFQFDTFEGNFSWTALKTNIEEFFRGGEL